MKLAVREPESASMLRDLERWPAQATSALSLVEVPRAIERGGHGRQASRRAQQALDRVDIIELDRDLLAEAARVQPPALRALDAIHLASALRLVEVDAFVTYDRQLGRAAEAVGLEVVSPGVRSSRR